MKKIKALITLFAVFIFSSCDDAKDILEIIVQDVDLTEVEIQLLAPSEGSIVNAGDINFNWASIESVNPDDTTTAIYYHLQIATPMFNEAVQVVFDSIFKNNNNHATVLDTGTYQWRVKAYYDSFNTTEYTVNSFKVDSL